MLHNFFINPEFYQLFFHHPCMTFLLTLWCPDEPYSQEVLQVVEERVAHSEVLMSPYGTGAARGHDEMRPVQSDARHTVVCVDAAGEWQLGSGPLEDCYQWHLKTLGHKHLLSSTSVLADHSWASCYLRHHIGSAQTVLVFNLNNNHFRELILNNKKIHNNKKAPSSLFSAHTSLESSWAWSLSCS